MSTAPTRTISGFREGPPRPQARRDRPAAPGRFPSPPTPTGPDRTGPVSDRLLAVRAAGGDDRAFAVLVGRHSAALLTLARRLTGNRQDAEDMVQESLLSAWRRLPDFRGDAAFRTWLYRIVTNRCLSFLRSRPVPPVALDIRPEPATLPALGAPEQIAESHAATRAVVHALAGLDPGQQACWILRELHGMHYEEIARTLSISEQTVRGRLFRTRRSLARAMEPWR
ncbi:DNA-directed RNA polymerase sigma-70 factor [Kitasatospora herbaricolor]|uniref:RNA polymerase sigma factor n=1 Tax=Kitasatospora herbaricolor TaxID=68217 RepID=UPI0017491B2E|nr:RNA polymerase sigma factor [Kitasatospora herbaricolor]MDQ0306188.1 RNA polymerase sigma-70 factor (ECF subfamily) [Kitasatospora herbaricolor]GGV51182.1 DNA-directed RNA polymerase sigma-70 factor [Kitasatospora herbaricolor]